MFKFIIYVDKGGAIRWKMVGNNNEILNDPYTKLDHAKKTVELIKRGAADAKVYWEDEEGRLEELSA